MTVVIWDNCEADLKFFVVERDLSHLNNKYVNAVGTSEEEDIEISNLVYNPDTGNQIIEMMESFPVDAVKNGALVVVLGCLP